MFALCSGVEKISLHGTIVRVPRTYLKKWFYICQKEERRGRRNEEKEITTTCIFLLSSFNAFFVARGFRFSKWVRCGGKAHWIVARCMHFHFWVALLWPNLSLHELGWPVFWAFLRWEDRKEDIKNSENEGLYTIYSIPSVVLMMQEPTLMRPILLNQESGLVEETRRIPELQGFAKSNCTLLNTRLN